MSTKPPSLQCSSILLVEDYTPLLRNMAFLLHVAGFKVFTAADGTEALKVMNAHVPDLVISDIDMPNMDGYELLRSVRANRHWRSVPVIFISDRYGLEDLMAALDLGAAGYLPKPFDYNDLMNAIEDVLPQRANGHLRPSA